MIPPAIASLTSVRTGEHECYERVVFDFKDDNLPDYEIAYAAPPFSGPSGIPIAVAGTRFVKVRFATTYARYPGVGSYDGPDVVRPAGFDLINEIHLIEEFEAVVVWVIGIDAEHVFRVGTLTNPTRIYVDIARS